VQGEPLHRRWLHALEADGAVPDYAMQVARIFADYAAKPSEKGVFVTWSTLRRETHQRRDKLSKAMAWLRDHGWLIAAECGLGKRSYYRLTIPVDSLVDNPPESSPGGGTSPDGGTSPSTGTTTSPDGGTTTSPDGGTTNVRTSGTSIENTAASRRDHAAGQRGRGATTRKGIDPAFIGDVAEELIGELKANAGEVSTITGMLERGEYPDTVRNTISAQRFGPRSQRQRSGRACPHNRPYAADGWADCPSACYRDPEPAETAQLVPDDGWSPAEPEDAAWLRGPHGFGSSKSTPTGRAVASGASLTSCSPWLTSSTRTPARAPCPSSGSSRPQASASAL
jgi:hypothetical protein